MQGFEVIIKRVVFLGSDVKYCFTKTIHLPFAPFYGLELLLPDNSVDIRFETVDNGYVCGTCSIQYQPINGKFYVYISDFRTLEALSDFNKVVKRMLLNHGWSEYKSH